MKNYDKIRMEITFKDTIPSSKRCYIFKSQALLCLIKSKAKHKGW